MENLTFSFYYDQLINIILNIIFRRMNNPVRNQMIKYFSSSVFKYNHSFRFQIDGVPGRVDWMGFLCYFSKFYSECGRCSDHLHRDYDSDESKSDEDN